MQRLGLTVLQNQGAAVQLAKDHTPIAYQLTCRCWCLAGSTGERPYQLKWPIIGGDRESDIYELFGAAQ